MLNFFRKKTNQKGFTLVEVIVVAVIVAILAAIGIPLYMGYVNDSAQNVAENTASSAASFLAAARAGATDFAVTDGDKAAGAGWTFTSAGGEDLVWTCPPNATITVAGSALTCTIERGGTKKTSASFSF